MAEANSQPRDISQDHKALFELLYLTREWLNKHHYYPMDAKFALFWVFGLLERASDGRWDAMLAALSQDHTVLKHRVEALEDWCERHARDAMDEAHPRGDAGT
jgi:hypothetical protein